MDVMREILLIDSYNKNRKDTLKYWTNKIQYKVLKKIIKL